MKTSDKTDAVWPAFAAAKGSMVNPQKTGTNPHFKSSYVTLNAVYSIVLPALQAKGLDLTFHTEHKDGIDLIYALITHVESNQFLQFGPERLVARDLSDPQKIGGAKTYAKRYMLIGLCALGEADDDGNKAAQGPSEQSKPESKGDTPETESDGPLYMECQLSKIMEKKTKKKKPYAELTITEKGTLDEFKVGIFRGDIAQVMKLEPGTWLTIEYTMKDEYGKSLWLKDAKIIPANSTEEKDPGEDDVPF